MEIRKRSTITESSTGQPWSKGSKERRKRKLCRPGGKASSTVVRMSSWAHINAWAPHEQEPLMKFNGRGACWRADTFTLFQECHLCTRIQVLSILRRSTQLPPLPRCFCPYLLSFSSLRSGLPLRTAYLGSQLCMYMSYGPSFSCEAFFILRTQHHNFITE